MNTVSSQRQAFNRFHKLISNGKEHELTILKGHMLIEEQLRLIIDKNLVNPSALENKIDCYGAICLAQSFFPLGHYTCIWESVKKLNNIRNRIAHNLDPVKFEKLIDNFIDSVPVDWSSIGERSVILEIKIWTVFIYVSSFKDGFIEKDVEMLIIPISQ